MEEGVIYPKRWICCWMDIVRLSPPEPPNYLSRAHTRSVFLSAPGRKENQKHPDIQNGGRGKERSVLIASDEKKQQLLIVRLCLFVFLCHLSPFSVSAFRRLVRRLG
eukprot:TRINITY_DN5514_c0_g1_i1.p2 TRINITY_DN5514_c0_g1~~TRINITY_DN5514_c0_g1_i1.p2  ORF type:complete len:107 (+),score=1.78 TRINITY_DN5514_c0_g1_i1:247-567(+)